MRLAAKPSEALFFMFQPLASASDASPAELRLAVRPAEFGASIDVIKRKGPTLGRTLTIAPDRGTLNDLVPKLLSLTTNDPVCEKGSLV
jgi:hypothetical protein